MASLPTALEILSAVLLVITLLRLVSTPSNSPYRKERTETTVLVALITAGAFGSTARDRFSAGTTNFWLASAALGIICALAILFVFRLFRAYRNSDDVNPKKSNTRSIRPPDRDDRVRGGHK